MTKADFAVTGATGFVGKHLLECLQEKGLSARALARDPARLAGQQMETVHGDLASHDALLELCRGVHTVIHCAGCVAAVKREAFEEVNVRGTENIVAAARQAGVRRFVLLSSLSAREPEISDYAASKRESEKMLEQGCGDMEWVAVRASAVYGPGDRMTLPLIKQLTQRIALVPGSKTGRASLVHVKDLTAALVALATAENLAGGIYELDDGHPNGYSWEEMAELSGRVQGRKVACVFLPRSAVSMVGHVEQRFASWGGRMPQVTPGKTAELYHDDWVCRNRLLQEHCDWAPTIGFEDGFLETIAWYRQEGWL